SLIFHYLGKNFINSVNRQRHRPAIQVALGTVRKTTVLWTNGLATYRIGLVPPISQISVQLGGAATRPWHRRNWQAQVWVDNQAELNGPV
ncbi:hypothetical protein, partial [Zoogloea sp.]|uniref:hypothetical protein n=1 Tax=Zoogloea sp. TaxID=49181 RepID=UPI002627F277